MDLPLRTLHPDLVNLLARMSITSRLLLFRTKLNVLTGGMLYRHCCAAVGIEDKFALAESYD